MPAVTFPRTAAAIVLAIASLASAVNAQNTTVLVDVDHRKTMSLNGEWHYLLDPYQGGLYNFHHEIRKDGYFRNAEPKPGDNTLVEYSFAQSPTLRVPGDWNTQRESLLNYEGLLWYQRNFDYHPTPGHKTYFHAGAANYESLVWINGQQACRHEGGFTSFDCDITSLVHPGANFVVVAVDDTRRADGVPTLNTDWYNYGGLTRDVSLVDVPATFIDDYDLHLNRARTAIEGYVHVQDGKPGAMITVSIPELHLTKTAIADADGRAAIEIPAKDLTLWSPEQPKLYKVHIAADQDALDDDIGFRTIEVSGTHILLNGKPIFLRGVSIHAEAPYRSGRANTDKDVDTLLGWAKELGCNFVRLAHYPHDERMTRATDRLGLLVWSEVPVYWAVHFDDPAVLTRAEQQLGENIRRDRNKASIALWSIANETPSTPARLEFLKTMAAQVRRLDSTRLVTAALLVRGAGHDKMVDDPLGQYLDVIGANEYIGWYEQAPEGADTTSWKIAYDKPLIMSEFGGGAKAGLHGPATQRWTEEYQASLFRHQLGMLNRIPQLRGISPWVLMDFRSPVRLLPGIQDGFNRKGLVSDKGEKKQAFTVLQQAYKDQSIGKAE